MCQFDYSISKQAPIPNVHNKSDDSISKQAPIPNVHNKSNVDKKQHIRSACTHANLASILPEFSKNRVIMSLNKNVGDSSLGLRTDVSVSVCLAAIKSVIAARTKTRISAPDAKQVLINRTLMRDLCLL